MLYLFSGYLFLGLLHLFSVKMIFFKKLLVNLVKLLK